MRIAVAMSGGVDSSVAAALLKDQGHEVIGFTLELYDDTSSSSQQSSRSCCGSQDIRDARYAANMIDIPHYTLNYKQNFFTDVIEPFANHYAKGLTPIPCVSCNETVKFRDLIKIVKEFNVQALATGHYVQKKTIHSFPTLHRGADAQKDQSYFLFKTTLDQLRFLEFPLGHLEKSETRQLAKHYKLSIADKPDSQNICFVPQGNYAQVVSKIYPKTLKKGPIYHIDGTYLGDHEGLIHYTVGQRKGLIDGHPTPLYVIRLSPLDNRVIVGEKKYLAIDTFYLQNINWLRQAPLIAEKMEYVQIKVRNSFSPVDATISLQKNNILKVQINPSIYGVSPGQACVFYKDDRMLGGGWILPNESSL